MAMDGHAHGHGPWDETSAASAAEAGYMD